MKLNISDLKNITPVGTAIKLQYETGYSGEEKTLDIRVYPLKVSEKILLQENSDALNKLVNIKERTPEQDKRVVELNDSINLDYAYYTMKKVCDDITREIIKESFPKTWYAQIFKATLKSEGIDVEEIQKEKN